MAATLKTLAVDFERALLLLDKQQATSLIAQAMTLGGVQEVIQQLIVQPLTHIGNRWQAGSVALSQVYMSGRICEGLIDDLLPQTTLARRAQPRMAIAVLNDSHALGKRIIYSSLRASGLELQDFGHGVTVDQLVQRTIAQAIDILFVSVLMYPSALSVKAVKQGLGGTRTKVMVGGAPFMLMPDLWRQVDADAFGVNAADALDFINKHTVTQGS